MDSDEQAIRHLISTWISATKAGDTQTVLSLMSDDVVFLIAGRPPMCGKATFAAGQNALRDFDMDGVSEVQEVKVLGDWAYVWTKLSVMITPRNGGPSVKRAGNTLSILKKHNGAWVLHRDANMLAVVPE